MSKDSYEYPGQFLMRMIIGILLFLFLMLGGILYFEMTPTNAQWTCDTYESQGHDVKVVSVVPWGYECWIKHDDVYIPMDKWLNVNSKEVKE